MIDNPAYIGEWKPRQIPNPAYFEDLSPVKSLKKIVRVLSCPLLYILTPMQQGGVGIELWTMTEDILFDNIYVGHSVEDAKALAVETFEIKKVREAELDKALEKEAEAAETSSFREDPVAFIRQQVFTFIELAKQDPVLAFKTHPETGAGLAGAVFTLFGMIGALFGLIGGQQKPITKVSANPAMILRRTPDLYSSQQRRRMPLPQTTRRRPTPHPWHPLAKIRRKKAA